MSASKMITGIGTPNSQSRIPRAQDVLLFKGCWDNAFGTLLFRHHLSGCLAIAKPSVRTKEAEPDSLRPGANAGAFVSKFRADGAFCREASRGPPLPARSYRAASR